MMHLLFFGLLNMNYDKIINPFTGKLIEKYERSWYYLIRKGYYDEAYLESLPVYNSVKPTITKVQNIDLNHIKPGRGGVILYCIKGGVTYFGFGVDRKYTELTDFAGGIRYKNDHNVIHGSLRELDEETLGLYKVNDSEVQDSVAIYDKHNLILFLKVFDDPIEVTRNFQEKYQNSTISEITAIMWVTTKELELIIKYSNTPIHKPIIMYERIRKFLAKAGDFYRFL